MFRDKYQRYFQTKFTKRRKKKKLLLSNNDDDDVILVDSDVIMNKLIDDVIPKNSVETISEQKRRTKLKKLKQFQNGTHEIEKLDSTNTNDPLLLQTSSNMTENLFNFLKNVGDKKNKVIDIGTLNGFINFFKNVSDLLQTRNEHKRE